MGAVPRGHEFVKVEGGPLLYEASRSWGKSAPGHGSEIYINHGLVFAVLGVEVGRRMVWDMNADDDAVEATEFRHGVREPVGSCRA